MLLTRDCTNNFFVLFKHQNQYILLFAFACLYNGLYFYYVSICFGLSTVIRAIPVASWSQERARI